MTDIAITAPGKTPGHADAKDETGFGRKVFLVAVAVVVLAALYKLSTVFLLMFGSVVVATVVHAIADPLMRRTKAPRGVAIAIAVAMILTLFSLALWAFGREIATQFATLADELPRSLSTLQGRIASWPGGERLLGLLSFDGASTSELLSSVRATLGGLINAGVYTLVVLVAGVVISFAPTQYRDGFLLLFPERRRARYRAALNASGRALKGWLMGQILAMSIIGVFVSAGLYFAGVPSWLLLGVFAGVAQFIPLIGPTISAIPGFFVAATIDLPTFLSTVIVYVGVQQVESNLITPIVMRRATSLPIVLTLFSIIAASIVFGPLGVALATPLTVVVYVLVQMLYVEDVIGEELKVKGEKRRFARAAP